MDAKEEILMQQEAGALWNRLVTAINETLPQFPTENDFKLTKVVLRAMLKDVDKLERAYHGMKVH